MMKQLMVMNRERGTGNGERVVLRDSCNPLFSMDATPIALVVHGSRFPVGALFGVSRFSARSRQA